MGHSFYYQNVRGLRSKTNTSFVNSFAIATDFICLTETFLNSAISDMELVDPSYQVYRRDRESTASPKHEGGGVLIAAKQGLHVVPMPSLQTGAEDLWLKVVCGKSFFLLCCVYLPPNAKEPLDLFLSSVCTIRDSYPSHVIIIVGDFNLPTIRWSPSDVDTSLKPIGNFDLRAHDFINAFSYCSFDQFNNVTNINNRLLDLVLCVNGQVNDVRPCTDPLVHVDSHHPPFEFSLPGISLFLSVAPKMAFLFKKANFDTVKSFLNDVDWQSVFAGLNIEDMVEAFYARVNDIINRLVPKRFFSKQRFPLWYSTSTIRVIKEKLKFHKKWKCTGRNCDYLTFSILRSRSKRLIAADYKTYLTSIEAGIANRPQDIWSFIKNKKGSSSGYPTSMTSIDGTVVTTGNDITGAFAEYFSSVFVDGKIDKSLAACGTGLSPWFSSDSIYNVLIQLDEKSSPGPDGIPSLFLKECATELTAPLFLIFSKSVTSGVFPSAWKKALIVPIFKSGNKQLVSNYRPISVLSTIPKVFEKIVVEYINHSIKHSIINEQHGFLAGRSVETNLVTYVNFIHSALNEDSQVDAIYTDYSKAFDKIDHNILTHKLCSLNIPTGIVHWIASYLSDRSQAVRVGTFVSEYKPITSGVPQGSHLGPTLFSIYLNDISSCFQFSKFLLYADDNKIFAKISSISDCLRLQEDLNRLDVYCRINKLFLNYNKCQKITFTWKRYPINFQYHLNNRAVESTDCVKDLGVLMDSKLRFHRHIDYVVKGALRSLGFVIRISRNFSNFICIKSLYMAFVNSVLGYCSVVWSPMYTIYQDRLESIQRRFVRYLAHKFHLPYCDYDRRCVIFDFLSLQKRRVMFDLIFLFKLVNGALNSPALLSELNFNIPQRLTRSNTIFRLNASNTNLHQNSPMVRIQYTYDGSFSHVPLFNTSLRTFQRSVRHSIQI